MYDWAEFRVLKYLLAIVELKGFRAAAEHLRTAQPKPRLAFPVDFVAGKTELPNGKIVPVALSELATAQGYRWFYRGPEQKLADRGLHRWLRLTVYEDKGLLALFALSFIEGGVCLVAMLWFAVPYDIRRFKQMKYGRILRGPQLLSPQEFNRQQKGDGIGFKTTELGKMMRIPAQKEAQHFQIMGDTGVGKTQLIMQILRQIRERGDSAIIYDPASEYLQRFYDKDRGDIILNPLDARCPYWGPAQEMASNAEADAIAASLYQPTTDVKDEFFHQTPAQIFAHLLRKGPTPQQLAEWMANSETLETLVAGTEMSFYIDRKAGPQRAGVLASLGLVAKCFRLLPEKDQTNRTWNARSWAKERKGWIFITSRPPERETLRPLHSLWIDLLVMRLLTAPQPGQRPVPAAGSCVECPKRTGHNRLLFGDVQQDACTDPTCYTAKVEAHVQALIASKPKLVQISTSYGGQPEGSTAIPRNKYVEIETEKPDTPEKAKRPEYKTCRFITEAVVTQGSEKGAVRKVCANPECPIHHAKKQPVKADATHKAEQEKQRREEALANATGLRVLQTIVAAVPVRLMKRDLLFIVESLLPLLDERRLFMVARSRGIRAKEGEAVGKLLTAFVRQADESILNRLTVEIVILLSARSQSDGGKVLKAAAQAYKVDTDAVALKVKHEFAAKEKARLAEKSPTKAVAKAQPKPVKKAKAA